MRRSEWLVRAALVFCLVYGVIALPDRNHERFPFNSWDLFSHVPPPRVADYSVRLVQAEGVHTRLPVYFEDSKLLPSQYMSQGFQAMQVWGKAIESGNRQRAAVLRRQFELTYLSTLTHVRYQVVHRVFDIRERVACDKCYVRKTVIANYTMG
jgi:hypothetical protein